MTSMITRPLILASLLIHSLSASADVVGIVEGVNVPSENITQTEAGKINVVINPAVTGVSYNAYSAFNVPTPGLDLDNRSVAAKMIINEVVQGGDISSIRGQLSVLGDQAHVVVANPNGVSVDGGSFFNTGNVTLTAAQIHQFQSISGDGVLSGDAESNPFYVIHAHDGSVVVGSEGLSGNFPRLDIIAKTVAVNGDTNVAGLLNVIGGDSTQILYRGSQIETIPVDAGVNLARYEFAGSCEGSLTGADVWDCNEIERGNLDEESDASYVVDVSGSVASLRAGKIAITVNDIGPGFRFAGDSLVSSADDLTLNANGIIEVSAEHGGQITGAGTVEFNNSADDSKIVFTGIDTSQTKLIAGEYLILNAGSGDLINQGYALQSIEANPSAMAAPTGVQIFAEQVFNESLSENALGIIFSSSNKVSSGGVDLDSSDRDTAGIVISATGNVYNDSGRIVSNNGLAFNLGGDFYNRLSRISGSNTPVVTSSRDESGWFIFRKHHAQSTYDYGELRLSGLLPHVEASAGDIKFNFTNNGRLFNIGGEITANGAQDFVVFDELSFSTDSSESVESEEANIRTITLRANDQSLTYQYEANEDDTADSVLRSFINFVENSRAVDPSLFSDISSLDLVATPAVDDSERLAVVIGSENANAYSIDIDSDRIGGSLLKSDGQIIVGVENLDPESSAGLTGAIFNQAVMTGRATFNSSCGWLCSQTAESSISSHGGLISAQNTIEMAMFGGAAFDWDAVNLDLSTDVAWVDDKTLINLGYQPPVGMIANIGGRVTALNAGRDLGGAIKDQQDNAISIRNASDQGGIFVLSKGLTTVEAINRDQGILGGEYAKLIKQDQGGSFIANQGQIDFAGLLSPVSIKIWGGEIMAAGGVTLDDEEDANDGDVLSEAELDPDRIAPQRESALSSSNLGLTGSLLESLF